jgi:predicted metal-dependent phosphoesterase TrpH
MRLKIDLHVHTTESNDAFIEVSQLPSIVKDRGIDGVAVTNHDALVEVPPSDVILISGIEVSTRQGHMIGLGVTGPIPKKTSADETISLIHRAGGVAVVAHPFDPVSRCVNPFRLTMRPDAIEVINSDALFFGLNRAFAKRAAERLNLPMVAGSDSHIPETVGDAYTLVDSDSRDVCGVLQAIRAGNVEPIGNATRVRKRLLKVARSLRAL